jgi:hypothetical protein
VIHLVTLGVALCDVDHKVREIGGNNSGPRIRQYLASLDPPMAVDAPWCAAAVQYWSDLAARSIGVVNPLDAVKLEALVQSYYDHFRLDVIGPAVKPAPGDLVLFKFPKDGKPSPTWNHIGIIAQAPKPGTSIAWVAEGNTGDVDQRDGDGVYLKPRDLGKLTNCVIRWAA